MPDATSSLPTSITENSRFFPFFKYALGAIDSSHISAFVPADLQARYRDHSGNLTQNVLAACTFDMCFCYILAGWEGSAADSAIFEHAQASSFIVPKGYYYLADARFPLCDILLVPFRSVHYHLQEWRAAQLRYI